jgi:flagellar basal body-associated protein FliL
MKYKDPKGDVLYGFSQENLERTNKELRKTNHLIQVMLIMMLVFLVITVALIFWVDFNNVITALVTR